MPLLPHVGEYLASMPPREPFDVPDDPMAYVRGIRVPFSVPGAPAVASVREDEVDGRVPVRVYEPDAPAGRPVVVYLHGGSFIVGDLDMHDTTCRRLANALGATVVNVDYRLAPEHPFPAPVDDCMDALRWAVANAEALGGDAQRVVIAGSSAGGTLAAGCAIRARDEQDPHVAAQLLVYPAIDVAADNPSWRKYLAGYGLDAVQGRWGWHQFLPTDEARRSPYGSPAAVASCAGLPPAVVVTAECDPLRDEGEDYARRMTFDGVAVELIRVPGQIHGFLVIPAFADDAAVVLDDAARALRALLAGAPG